MKKQIKIISLLIIFVLIIGVTTISNAAEPPEWFAFRAGQHGNAVWAPSDVSNDNTGRNDNNDIGRQSAFSSASTESIDGFWVMCMSQGLHLRNTEVDNGTKDGPMDVGEEKYFERHDEADIDENDYKTDKDGYAYGGRLAKYTENRIEFTNEVLGIQGSWLPYDSNTRYRTVYDNRISLNEDDADVQKLIYELYRVKEMFGDRLDVAINLVQALVWESGINTEETKEWRYEQALRNSDVWEIYLSIAEEGNAYRAYYEDIKNNGINPTINSYENTKAIVDQTTQSYIVGPFSVDYITGSYEDRRFSKITSLQAIDENGNNLELIEIVDENGNHLEAENLLPNSKFYVRVRGNSSNMKIHTDFEYIVNGTASLYKYTGVVYGYYYDFDSPREQAHEHSVFAGINCGKTEHKHDSSCYIWNPDLDPEGNPCLTPVLICGQEEHEHNIFCENWEYLPCSTGYEVIHKEIVYHSNETQQMLAYGLDAELNWTYPSAETSLVNLPHTMKIAGKVFLDEATGKANTGNNLFDDGEGLPGVDVWLYDSNDNLVAMALTNDNGDYEFNDLNVFKKYYVKFAYNGMLYTNVNKGTGNNASKVEEKQGDRNYLNNKFKEIGSYPNNYVTTDFETGNQITNKVYYQEDLIELFKEVAKEMVNNGGNEVNAYNAVIRNHSGDSEIRNKVQFIRDCRIYVYSDTYPKINMFVTDDQAVIGPYGIVNSIYADVRDNQLHINLGIKTRPTFDVALYQDVYKAEVKINGKTQTYTYDDRKAWMGEYENGFPIGVSQDDYLSSVRKSYIEGTNYTTGKRERNVETDTYNLEMRTEDIKNGTMTEIKDGYASAYTNLSDADKLKIFVTYRISLRNQSGVDGIVTEVVDYYDKNYTFVSAYLGNANGNNVGGVSASTTSKYGGEYTSNKYQTIYLRPDEVTLNNNNQNAYIYVTLELKNSNEDAGKILSEKILGGEKYNTINLAEINGYKTNEGLIDIDSNPGNLDIRNIKEFTDEALKVRKYEDDESKAPSFVYSLRTSRTLEGTVFEDLTGKDSENNTNKTREGNGKLDNGEKGVQGVLVELVEVKNNELKVRATAITDENGNYKFIGYIPGDYKIRYTYGSSKDKTVETSFVNAGYGKYNGQDYESTKYNKELYRGQDTYDTYNRKTGSLYYWYKNNIDTRVSDAADTIERINTVRNYSNTGYGVGISNHKAEVFNSIYNKDATELLNELKEKTYREAFTEQMSIDLEYEAMQVKGNQATEKYEYKITNVDFGIVERAHEKLKVEKTVSHIKLTLTDGTVLFDANGTAENLQWADKQISAIADDEQINGAKIEITYNIKVSNLSEANTGNTKIKTIVDYVANNLNFDSSVNNGLWEVVNIADIQKDNNSTLVNKGIDLSTRTTTIKAAANNPLIKTLAPGGSAETSLVLTKVLSTENVDDLSYENTVEIVEYENDIGRYDRESIPGNLVPDEEPQQLPDNFTNGLAGKTEEDSAKAGTVAVLPPFGSTMIYYTLAGVVLVMLGVGIFLIKKKVVDKK